jgi:hypothetical protein
MEGSELDFAGGVDVATVEKPHLWPEEGFRLVLEE